MHGTKTFTLNGEPYIELEMISNTDENGKCCINAKILKPESEESFDVVIKDMNKFDINGCKGIIVRDGNMDKTYEYIVFSAGYKIPNKIVVIDVVNMTYSTTYISGTFYINGFNIVVDDESLIVDSDVVVTDGYCHRIRLHFIAPIENFERIFENIYVMPYDKRRNIPRSRIEFYLKDGTISGYSTNSLKHSTEELELINKKEEVETKVTDTTEINVKPTEKEEPTPSKIISQYADLLRSIAAHLDQIVEILEGYIEK